MLAIKDTPYPHLPVAEGSWIVVQIGVVEGQQVIMPSHTEHFVVETLAVPVHKYAVRTDTGKEPA